MEPIFSQDSPCFCGVSIFWPMPYNKISVLADQIMDIISHGLINNLIFKDLPANQRWWAIAFGILPDLASLFGVYRLEFFKKMLFFKRIPQSYVPHWVFRAYNIAHSFPLWLIIFLALWLFGFKLIAIAWCGWLVHLVLDIFTHGPDSVIKTRVLWPFSRWSYAGFVWSSKKFLLVEYIILALLYLWVY